MSTTTPMLDLAELEAIADKESWSEKDLLCLERQLPALIAQAKEAEGLRAELLKMRTDDLCSAAAERDALKAELAEAMNELDSIYGVLGTADAEGGEPAAHTIDCMQTELVAANARVAELEGALEPMKSGGMAGKWGVIKAHLVIAGFKETAAEITRLQAKVDAALESGARL